MKKTTISTIILGSFLSTACLYANVANEPLKELTFTDILASKVWILQDYNQQKLNDAIKADIGIFAKAFTPDIYKSTKGNDVELGNSFNEISNRFGDSANVLLGKNLLYTKVNVQLGSYNLDTHSFTVSVPKVLFFNTFNNPSNGGEVYGLINKYNLLTQYQVNLSGSPKNLITDVNPKIAEKALSKNQYRNGCLHIAFTLDNANGISGSKVTTRNYNAKFQGAELGIFHSCNQSS